MCMLATIPYLIHVKFNGFEGYLLSYADSYENACAKIAALYPEPEMRNCTLL